MKQRCIVKWFGKHKTIVLLSIILLIQIIVVTYIGAHRQGLHIDEYYSYLLSNSYDADRISNAPDVWNRWISGEEFSEFLTVEKGEQFSYKVVYENNTKDAHPPLFYFLLHTVCSLFPGVWSPWIGMGMNILLILLVEIVLYKFGRELFGDTVFAVVPVAIYGGMQVFVDTALFIRMYPLMTLLTVLLTWQHYKLIIEGPKKSTVVLCGVFTFLGVFTQYYFVFAAFFMAAVYCICLLVQKSWKSFLSYAISMLFGVLLVFVVFPAGISQITGSETNNVGKEVAGNILNFSGWGTSILSMIQQMLVGVFKGVRYNARAKVVVSAVILIVLLVLRLKQNYQTKEDGRVKQSLWFALFLTVVVALSVVVISHVTGKFLYVRYLYNLFPLIALLMGLILWLISEKLQFNKLVVACGVIVIALMSSGTIANYQLCSYMFEERTESDRVIIEECKDKPMIMLNNGTTHQPTGLLHILMECDTVYLSDYNNMELIDSVLDSVDCSGGVTFIVLTDVVWTDGFEGISTMTEITEQSEILDSFEVVGECSFSTAYVAYPDK